MEADDIKRYIDYGMELALLGLRIHDAAQNDDEASLRAYLDQVADRVGQADQAWQDAARPDDTKD